MARQRYSFVPSGGRRGYDWSKDYTVVKASPDTGGAFALMEDNLKLEFALGLHLHRQHAETCYTLDGEINFLHRRRLDGPHIRIGRRADRKEWLHRKTIVAAFGQTLGSLFRLLSVAVWNIGGEGHVDLWPLMPPLR